MNENPFTSATFKECWHRNFNQKGEAKSFAGISGIDFVKSGVLPFYQNVGKNLTKGLTYVLEDAKLNSLGHKVLMIRDVHPLWQKHKSDSEKLKVHAIKQYPGFQIDLTRFSDLNDYLTKNFSKKSRYKFKKYKKRLETSFDISYRVFSGNMVKTDYDQLFHHFKSLLEKRYAQKKIYNNNLDPNEWQFYREVTYPLMLEEKAAMFITLQAELPIAITLLFIKGTSLIHTITVFDTDYSKFHLGACSNLQLIQWGIDNHFQILDFSKGYFEYKAHWCTREYQFEHHFLYNPRSPVSSGIAFFKSAITSLKAFLRSKNLNLVVHRLRYFLEHLMSYSPSNKRKVYVLKDDLTFVQKVKWHSIALEKITPEVRKGVFEFLYLKMENLNDLQLFQSDTQPGVFRIEGKHMHMYLIKNTTFS